MERRGTNTKKIVFLPTFYFFQRDDKYYFGVLVAVTACISGGTMDVLVAKCGEVSTSVLVIWSSVTGLVMSVVYNLIQDSSSHILSSRILEISWQQWITFLGLTILGMLAFTSLTRSLQLISPNLVASLRCLELVLAFIVQSLITDVLPDIVSATGAVLITIGVLMVTYQEKVMKIKEELMEKMQFKIDRRKGS